MSLLGTFADAIASLWGFWLRGSVSGSMDAGKPEKFTHFGDLLGNVGIVLPWDFLGCEAEIVF